jgi:hypothetical protein
LFFLRREAFLKEKPGVLPGVLSEILFFVINAAQPELIRAGDAAKNKPAAAFHFQNPK